jgi:hypothetical protein
MAGHSVWTLSATLLTLTSWGNPKLLEESFAANSARQAANSNTTQPRTSGTNESLLLAIDDRKAALSLSADLGLNPARPLRDHSVVQVHRPNSE